jgi:DNA-binding transcriptional LysR family regulator
MDTEALRFFQQVVDGATVTEVAELYHVSQPAVSRSLRRLEQDVGPVLLERSGRILRTTYAGSVFKRHVDAALHALDDGLAAMGELVEPETGTVRVTFQLSLGTWFVPEVIATFLAKHPRVRFQLEHSQDVLGSSLVAGGSTDLEFTARRPRNPEVGWERLFSQPLRLAVPADHPLATRTQVGLADAADEDFVLLTPDWELRALSEELCQRAGFTPRVVFEQDDIPVLLGFVSAGLGVGIVPVPAAHDVRRASAGGVRLVRLTDAGAFRDVGLAWSRTRRLLPSAQLFRSHVLEHVRSGRS